MTIDDLALIMRIRKLKFAFQVEELPVCDLVNLAHMVRRGDLRHVDEPSEYEEDVEK